MAQVFISYSSKDETKAMKIVNHLESSGITCWIASRDISVGGDFGREIPPEIRKCAAFVLLLSKNSLASDDVYNELVLARKNMQGKLIIPLLLEQCDPLNKEGFEYHLAKIQIRRYFDNPSRIMTEVIKTIKKAIPLDIARQEKKKTTPSSSATKSEEPSRLESWLKHTFRELFEEKYSDMEVTIASTSSPSEKSADVSQEATAVPSVPQKPVQSTKSTLYDSRNRMSQIDSNNSTAAGSSLSKQPKARRDTTTYAAPPTNSPVHESSFAPIHSSLYDKFIVNKSSSQSVSADSRQSQNTVSQQEPSKQTASSSLYDKYIKSKLDADEYFNNGQKYWNQKQYEAALPLLNKSASMNHAKAQYLLACCYSYGKGVEKNSEKALEWYQKAAENGNMPAQEWLGIMYCYGIGLSKDLDSARKWFQKAADQGSSYAIQQLYLINNKK